MRIAKAGRSVLTMSGEGGGVFGATKVDNHPGDVAQKADRDFWADKLEQRLDNAELDAVVAEVGAIA